MGQEYNCCMIIRKAFKFRLNMKPGMEEKFFRFAGCARFVWNKALAMNLERLNNKQPILYYQELDFWSKIWKKSDEYRFLKDCQAHVIQQKLKDLQKAFLDAFEVSAAIFGIDLCHPWQKSPRLRCNLLFSLAVPVTHSS